MPCTPLTTDCIVCGDPLAPPSRKARTCSVECRAEKNRANKRLSANLCSERARARRAPIVKQCIICETEFAAKSSRARVCSGTCLQAHKLEYMRSYNAKLRADAAYSESQRIRSRERYKPVPRRFVACVVCREPIRGADKRSKVCSVTCRHALTLANNRRWNGENTDKRKTYEKAYRQRNPEKQRERCRRYEEQNRDKRRAWHRQWMAKNRDHVNAYSKARRKADPERYREYSRRLYAKRSPEIREAARLYRQKNIEKVTATQRAKYIRERAAVELVKDLGLIELVRQHGAENETGKTV